MATRRQALPQLTDDDPGVAAWSALLRTHARIVRVLEQEVEDETGLPLSWYDVLLELAATPEGRLRMQALASRVVLSRTRVSRLVGEIAAAGLVERVPDPDDGRATFAVITDRGRAQLRARGTHLPGRHPPALRRPPVPGPARGHPRGPGARPRCPRDQLTRPTGPS